MRVGAPHRVVLLGHPVAHSLSPRFQQAAITAARIPATYEALDVGPQDLQDVLESLRQEGAAGNVTVPHKEAVARACTVLTDIAARTAAVNTFWVTADGALAGDNTDVYGFERAAESLGIVRHGQTVACLGSGGAAAAVCEAVRHWPDSSIRLWGRSADRAQELARRAAGPIVGAASPAEAVHGATLVVNATPIGLAGDAVPMPAAAIPRDAFVMDLVYRADETLWVRQCRTLGLRAADGKEMLLHQGAAAFERWFGVAPNLEIMRAALS